MSGKDYESFVSQLKKHEGEVRNKDGRHALYICPAGYFTFGWGYNVQANGVSDAVAGLALRESIEQAMSDVEAYLGAQEAYRLDPVRFYALANMAFNLGGAGLNKFKNTRKLIIAALDNGDWDAVAKAILNSKYARQDVPNRAKEIAEQIRTGKWQ